MIVDTEKIVMITVGQLKEFASSIVRETIDAIQAAPAPIAPKPTTEYRYGLRAISDMFDVCHVTAQRYKDTFLKPAIEQRGRKIRVDVALAQKLYKEHTQQ
ncbi:MAG: DUF3853 family protein [Muribaculaceae bacterium]